MSHRAAFDGRWIGAAVPRKEDRRMLLGRSRFAGDLTRPGLLERVCFDRQGQPVSATLMDYLAPTAAEMCAVDIVHLQTPSRFSETGAKGMGEGGTIGAPAAVLNAINDALGDTGVQFDHIPVLPQDLSGVV